MNNINIPYLEKRFDAWEVNAPCNLTVNTSADTMVVIDKLYGPLCASEVRVHLDLKSKEWVVEYMNPSTEEWEIKARWDCQENWPND